MHSSSSRRLGVVVAVVMAGCGGAPDYATAPEARTNAVANGPVSAPFDLGQVVRQVHFAYRPDGADFVATDRTYTVRVSDQGRVAIGPVDHPPVAASPSAPRATIGTRRTASAAVIGASLSLQTTDIERDGAQRVMPSAVTHVAQDGSLSIDRGIASESLRNGETGVEQSWAFATEPAGTGDLTIRVQVSGEQFAGETPQGLHFVDPVSGLGLRYGVATWVDARGTRTELQSHWDGSAIVITVPGDVVAVSAFPAVLDPTVGPEFGLDNPVRTGAVDDQFDANVAFDGTNYFVVWSDERNYNERDVFGARVTRTGAVLDPAGIAICTNVAAQRHPTLAFDGANYLVVWEDDRDTMDIDVRGARVSKAGVLLDGPPDTGGIAISTAPSYQQFPVVAFDGTNFLVVWMDPRVNDDIWGARVSRAGVLVDSPPDTGGFQISEGPANESFPALAFDGTNYLVVYEDDRHTLEDIMGARVSPAGFRVGVEFFICDTDERQSSPAVAFDGTNYLVAWTDDRADGVHGDIYGARVSRTGMLLDGPTDTGGIAISTAESFQGRPVIGFDGTNYLVAWGDDRNTNSGQIFGARVSKAGALIDGPADTGGFVIGAGGPSGIAFDGTNYFVVRTGANVGQDIVGSRVSRSGTVLDSTPALISSRVANTQANASAAFDGRNYLVVWQDDRGTGNQDIYGVRVTSSGAVLDPSGLAISANSADQLRPVVAYDGARYLVAWIDFRNGAGDIFGARVTTTGAVSDAAGIAISTATGDQVDPTIAATSGRNKTFLVAWADVRNGTDYDVYGARIDDNGVVLDPSALALGVAANDQQHPAAAYDGTRFLVAWEDTRSGSGFGDIYGRRINTNGTLQDGAGLVINAAQGDQVAPAVTAGGNQFFVVWEDWRSGSGVIRGTRVSDGGSVVDPASFAISSADGDQTAPAATYNGRNYFVAWEDSRSGTRTDIYGSRVTTRAVVQDASGLALATEANDKHRVALAGDTSGNTLACYQRLVPEFASQRVRSRFIAP